MNHESGIRNRKLIRRFSVRVLDSCFLTPASHRPGFAALTTVIFVVSISTVIITGITFVSLHEASVVRNQQSSVLAYYGAEAGIEDAVYRFVTGKQISSGEALATGTATGSVVVATLGSKKTITVTGLSRNAARAVAVEIEQAPTPVGFSYGVQVGNGGLTLGDGSKIAGDVFSNGNISGAGASKSTITGTAQAAGPSLIKDVNVQQNAYAGRLEDCSVGSAYYFTSIEDCTVATTTTQMSGQLAAIEFPISETEINAWKESAVAGGTQGTTAIGNNDSVTLGPKKINGGLSIGNSNVITLDGTLWVTGSISFGNTNTLKLAPGYGGNSGILIADGPVDFGNSTTIQGSGQSGSYIMIISLYGPSDAIDIGNNATSSILYAPNGIIDIGNGLSLREATGYGLKVGNNATVTYEQGLLNVNFTSGPTANWAVRSWKEVE